MYRAIYFALFGYLSGSILYARVFTRLFGKEALLEESPDKNPGTFNAFKAGGFWCGLLTLAFDLLKGYLPVMLYLRGAFTQWGLALVLSAPVLGHNFSVLYKFKGGKGIAVTFGCLLGLPQVLPVGILAAGFLFFSLVLCITPHYHRTLIAYLFAALSMVLLRVARGVRYGFFISTLAVCTRLLQSKEAKEKCKVVLPWKR